MTPSAAFALLQAHVPVALACCLLLWRWQRRLFRGLSLSRWLAALLSDAATLATASMLGIAVLGARGYFGFLTLRFAAQVLFGEAVLFLVGTSLLHFRHDGWFPPRRSAPPSRRGVVLTVLSLALIATYWEAYHRCPYALEVRRHSLDITRGSPSRGTIRILHLSDLQTHAIRHYERDVFRQAAALDPDLIVFTGDYLQSRSRPNLREGSASFRALLQETRLRPRYGFFATQGDCEESGWGRLFDGLKMTCLTNESRVIPLEGARTLILTGLDRKMSRFPSELPLRRLLASAPPGDYHLVMGHAPDFLEHVSAPSGIDLALAGHTHGGQVVIPGFGPPVTFSKLPRRFAGGMNRYKQTPLHVSRGIGMERGFAPQIRFLCPPEICLIELRY